VVALASWVLGTVHLVDHVIRGELVVHHGLDPMWNHSGWPFQSNVTLFTISAAAVQVLVLGGVIATVKGRLWAGYWLATGTVMGVLVTFVHFVPGPRTETPAVIFSSYHQTVQSPWGGVLGVLAVAVTVAVVVAVGLIIAAALRARRLSGRW
jgi:hypothetical protein